MASGQFDALRAFLQRGLNSDELRAIREQKLLFKIPIEQQPDFLSLFSTAAHRCLGSSEAQYATHYASFVDHASRIESSLSSTLRSLLLRQKTCSFSDLLFSLDTWLEQSYEHISSQVWSRAKPELAQVQSSVLELSSLSEETLQSQIGSTNDVLFAGAHLLNEAAEILRSETTHASGSNKRLALAEALPELVVAANQWNSCLYAIDKVTYGEWRVKEIDSASCKFELVDTRLEFSRIVGLRREAVQRIRKLKRAGSGLYIQEQLEKLLPHFLEAALGYFGQKCGLVVPFVSYWDLQRRLKQRLTGLESSDDLLLVAAREQGGNVFSDYVACAAVRWFDEICYYARNQLAKRRQRLGETSFVRRSVLLSFLPLDDETKAKVGVALESICKYPPRESFYSLLDHPSILLKDDSIAFIRALDGGRWSASIRSKWTRYGGLGNRYGKVWEEYIGWLITQRGWSVLKRNVKLRRHGRFVTDVDLLLARDNVCLVVQLKALAGAGLNTYQHWKNGQTIEKGIFQAKSASDVLSSSAGYFASIVGGRAARFIEIFRPVVLSTLHYFNGWEKDGVSIISVHALENLMRGATVGFWSSKKEMPHKIEHSIGCQVTGRDLLDFLDRPVDWRISTSDETVSEHSFQIQGASWTVPFLGKERFGLELHPDS